MQRPVVARHARTRTVEREIIVSYWLTVAVQTRADVSRATNAQSVIMSA